MTPEALHQALPRLIAGASLPTAHSAMILVHGRGGDAEDMMQLGLAVADERMALIALRAANNSWYPDRFTAPFANNEPWLSSALQAVGEAVQFAFESGIAHERIILLGFSQGACLSLEFSARNARRFGGVVGLSGGLIGPEGTSREYPGTYAATPVLLGCSDRDPHIPVGRVHETATVLTGMGAIVDERIYKGLGHTVIDDEVNAVRSIVAEL
jgi:predicted esterase